MMTKPQIIIISILLFNAVSAFVIKQAKDLKNEHELGNFTSAAVAIDGRPCAQIGK